MKMADILRGLADELDSAEQGAEQPGAEPAGDAAPTMMPPLQQKIELLKKAVDVPNKFDGDQEQGDELDQMKQRAGISPVIIDSAAEDNDIAG